MKRKVYFVLGGFPVVSHPFLYNQISEVIRTNKYEVRIVSLSRTGEEIHEAYKGLDDYVIHFSLGSAKGLIERIGLIFTSFFSLLFKNPMVLISSMNYFKYSRNAFNGNYLILSNQFLKIKPDLLHCHFGPTANIITDLKEIGAIKSYLITSFHGMDITVYPKQYGNDYYKRNFSLCDVFTGNSKFIINKMIETGCNSNQIVKIPMSLDTTQFVFRDSPPRRDIFKILTVGRFVEKKGYEFSLRAVALLKEAGVQFVYNIIGDGPLKDEMTALTYELGISDCVKFHGAMKQNQVMEFYSSSHVFLLPSVTASNGDTEGQGLVLQEAQSIGVPILATLHNGFPDSIIDGHTGFLVPEKDYQALYDKLLILAKDEALCENIGRAGRKFVEENFESKIIVKRLTLLYEQLLTTGKISDNLIYRGNE